MNDDDDDKCGFGEERIAFGLACDKSLLHFRTIHRNWWINYQNLEDKSEKEEGAA